jgi:glycosyltransferase involved in cell wall biosynthesis/GT2 family glycosyltransferase
MFSVIIPVFNHERYLRQAVLSAVRSRLVSEVLLLDDGSSDSSYELVRELAAGSLAKVRDVTPTERVNRGAHVCLNELTAKAACEWVAVLNSDDTFVADRFEVIQRRLRTEKAGFVFGDLSVVDEKGRQLGVKNGPFHPQYPFPKSFSIPAMAAKGEWVELLANQNFIATTSNIVFRKSLFDKVGGFAPYRYIHDWDFALRAALSDQVMYLAHPLTCYRVHASNTIKESASKVDEEVRVMFGAIERDYPGFSERPGVRISLAGNEYIHPAAKHVLNVSVPDSEIYLPSLESKIEGIGEGGLFGYVPLGSLDALRPDHLQNALLGLAFQDLDFILVSHSLAEPPMVGITSPQDAIVFRERARGVLLHGEQRTLHGRVARLLPGEMPPRPLELTFPTTWEAPALDSPVADGIVFRSSGKPVVFILPALFAVGGVERLMVEMMRQLRDRYEFVVITVERLSTGQGSLHGQADGAMLACYDLAELAPPDLFLPMMRRLKQIYQPALVWVPNGSPWQCDNAGGIREVFRDIPIVDQQAYDTEAGWIVRYHEPGIQAYDRFVAINTKIAEVQRSRYGIPDAQIDLIYHSINLDALGPMVRSETERQNYRAKYQLPSNGKIFGWVGRLTRQKRPLEFLTFVERHPEDHFLMIGNGELAAECDAQIAARQIGNVTAVRFSNTMAELFAVMSGLLSVSEYEGLPISMLEAIAMGVPVFSTDVGDVGIILHEYQCGEITAAAWDLERYSAGFAAWKKKLPFRAVEAAPKVRERFGGPAVAGLYDACFRRAIEGFRLV